MCIYIPLADLVLMEDIIVLDPLELEFQIVVSIHVSVWD